MEREKERGRDGGIEAERKSEREVQVSISWMAVLLWEQDVGSLFPKKCPPSFLPPFLPSFPSLHLSSLHTIHSLSLSCSLSSSLSPITSHHMSHLCLSLSLPVMPAHPSPLCPFSISCYPLFLLSFLFIPIFPVSLIPLFL